MQLAHLVRMERRRRPWGRDRGTAGVGLATGATALLLLAMLAAGGLGVMTTSGRVGAAAAGAARIAARAPAGDGGGTRADRAESAVWADLGAGDGPCRSIEVITTTDRGSGTVAVEVACVVDLSAVALVGFPASTVIVRRAVEPLDSLRGGRS